MTFIGAIASYFLKKASSGNDVKRIYKNKYVYFGGLLYLISAILNIFLLRLKPYSVILPLTSITYIWTMLISYLFLNEKITAKKICGVILIMVGAILIV
jgi:drug/metabolite transporter (DMT)-like permease